MEQLANLLPFVLIIGVFWLLVIRPANKRQRNLRELQSSLGPGDTVMLSSGFYGTVQQIGEDRIDVAIADGVVVQVAKAAIASREESRAADVEQGPEDRQDPSAPEH